MAGSENIEGFVLMLFQDVYKSFFLYPLQNDAGFLRCYWMMELGVTHVTTQTHCDTLNVSCDFILSTRDISSHKLNANNDRSASLKRIFKVRIWNNVFVNKKSRKVLYIFTNYIQKRNISTKSTRHFTSFVEHVYFACIVTLLQILTKCIVYFKEGLFQRSKAHHPEFISGGK